MIVGNINYFNKGVGYVCTFLERDLENSRNYFSELTPWILKGHWVVNNFLLIHFLTPDILKYYRINHE